jgi:hypothetical protein
MGVTELLLVKISKYILHFVYYVVVKRLTANRLTTLRMLIINEEIASRTVAFGLTIVPVQNNLSAY